MPDQVVDLENGCQLTISKLANEHGQAIRLIVRRDGERIGDLTVPLAGPILKELSAAFTANASQVVANLAALGRLIDDTAVDDGARRTQGLRTTDEVAKWCFMSSQVERCGYLRSALARGDWSRASQEASHLKELFERGA